MMVFSKTAYTKKNALTRYVRDEDGAVTVDWVVLTATLIFMGIAIAFYMATTVPEVGEKVGDYMSEMTVVER